MDTKSAFSSMTLWGIATTAAGFFGNGALTTAIQAGQDAQTHAATASGLQTVLVILGSVIALVGRWRAGDLTIFPVSSKTENEVKS